MEVKIISPDFEKQIKKSGVYIIELEFLGKNRSCMLLTEQLTTNHYNHRIKIQVDEKDILLNCNVYWNQLPLTHLQYIEIHDRKYYLANYEREMYTDAINLMYVCLDGIEMENNNESNNI